MRLARSVHAVASNGPTIPEKGACATWSATMRGLGRHFFVFRHSDGGRRTRIEVVGCIQKRDFGIGYVASAAWVSLLESLSPSRS